MWKLSYISHNKLSLCVKVWPCLSHECNNAKGSDLYVPTNKGMGVTPHWFMLCCSSCHKVTIMLDISPFCLVTNIPVLDFLVTSALWFKSRVGYITRILLCLHSVLTKYGTKLFRPVWYLYV